jgi:hypothetical protein
LKNAVEAGRQSRHTAARPVSQVSTADTSVTPWWPLNSSVARPNSTVDRMRARFLPWLAARAIHSHRAISAKPTIITSVMMRGRMWLSWAVV